MFELVLQKSIVFFRGNDVRALTCILTRSISLPFAPYPGLMLDIGAGPYEAISFITYHHENPGIKDVVHKMPVVDRELAQNPYGDQNPNIIPLAKNIDDYWGS